MRLIVSDDWVLAEPEDTSPFSSGRLLAPGGEKILRDEARLAGAFGQTGVRENLDMICKVARSAGGGPAWVELNIEGPALEKISLVYGQWKGAKAKSEQAPEQRADARKKRLAERERRGRDSLEKYFGPGWEHAVFYGAAPDPKTGRWEVTDEQAR